MKTDLPKNWDEGYQNKNSVIYNPRRFEAKSQNDVSLTMCLPKVGMKTPIYYAI